MNTPRSKPPIRWGHVPPSLMKGKPRQPDGQYQSGLQNPGFLLLIGQIATLFPLVENGMIEVLGDLLGSSGEDPARQVFASINSHTARVKVMTSLLEHSFLNRDKPEEYDKLIADFDGVSKSRNVYVHHIWWTHSSGRVILAPPSVAGYGFFEGREVTMVELEGVIQRMVDITRRIHVLRLQRSEEQPHRSASQETPPRPLDGDSGDLPPALHTSDEEPAPQPQASDPSPQSGDQA